MNVTERQHEIIAEFAQFQDWEERYKHLIALGKALEPYPEPFRTDDYKVKGCQSQVWLHAKLTPEGRIVFSADSDAMIVKGLAAVLLRVYSDAEPRDILTSKPDFLREMGLENHLSPSRANGLYSMIRQILYYATAFATVLGST